MASLNPLGYTAVLRNRNFLWLWLAQIFSNAALNAFFFLSIILIEDLTGSSTQLAGVILAFTLPSVLFSAIAGVVVDRIAKKYILIVSNALRVITAASLALVAKILLSDRPDDLYFLSTIYFLVFLSSAIGQFFAPAEGSTIPLLVESENLLTANSLFAVTLTMTQVFAVAILAPLGTKVIGITASLWVVTVMYIIATLLVTLIPRDQPARALAISRASTIVRAWNEIREGWDFAISQRAIFIALLQLGIAATLTMIMTMLAPGYAARVLGLQAEDAIVVFWPVGAGMFLTSILIGRYGNRIPRPVLASLGVLGLGVSLVGLAFGGRFGIPREVPIFLGYPELIVPRSALVMFFSLFIGITITLINVPAQTIVQEKSPDTIRGRVLAVQFTLASAMGIPPMLFAGTLADIFGIPRVTFGIAIVLLLIGLVNLAGALSATRRARADSAAPLHHSPSPHP